MAIEVTCSCGSRISAPSEFAGRAGRCRKCGARIVIPDPAADPFGLARTDVPDSLRTLDFGEAFDEGEAERPAPGRADVPRLPCTPGPYIYQMIQITPVVSVDAGQSATGAAAGYLERVVNREAEAGWEFLRLDPFHVEMPPGCFASLFGGRPDRTLYLVATFRRAR